LIRWNQIPHGVVMSVSFRPSNYDEKEDENSDVSTVEKERKCMQLLEFNYKLA